MPAALSNDLRKRVIEAIEGGMTCRGAAERYGVSVASAVKWSQRWRESGSKTAKPSGGVRREVLADERDWLRGRLSEQPDLTLRALQRELEERDRHVSYGALWRFVRLLGLSFKKNAARQRAEPT
jgi:transposase